MYLARPCNVCGCAIVVNSKKAKEEGDAGNMAGLRCHRPNTCQNLLKEKNAGRGVEVDGTLVGDVAKRPPPSPARGAPAKQMAKKKPHVSAALLSSGDDSSSGSDDDAAAPDRAQKRGQATASTGAAVTYVQGLIQTIQTPPIPPIQCMHGGSYISGASCARTTWLGLISTLKIRLEPLVVVPRCEGEWCGCYPLRTRGNSNEIG